MTDTGMSPESLAANAEVDPSGYQKHHVPTKATPESPSQEEVTTQAEELASDHKSLIIEPSSPPDSLTCSINVEILSLKQRNKQINESIQR